MIFFRFRRKLVKMKFVSWKLQNWFFLHMQLKTTSLLKEKAVATQSSTLSWQIPWTEEPGRLQTEAT